MKLELSLFFKPFNWSGSINDQFNSDCLTWSFIIIMITFFTYKKFFQQFISPNNAILQKECDFFHTGVNSGFDDILCIYIYISMTYGAYEKITTWGRVSEKKKKKILKKQVVYNEHGKKGAAYNELWKEKWNYLDIQILRQLLITKTEHWKLWSYFFK